MRREVMDSDWSAVVFRLTPRVMAFAALLAIVSMTRYPGGTPRDHHTSGYAPAHNFLSDLGMTVAYNGMPNRLGATLFAASLVLLVLALSAALIGFARLYQGSEAARVSTRLAMGCGVITGASFVGVAFTRENAAMDLHVTLTNSAFRLFPTVTLFLGIAAYRASRDRWIVLTWFALTVLLAAFAGFVSWGPAFSTPDGLVSNVIAQKVVVVCLFIAVAFLCARTERALAVGRIGSSLRSGF
jgi:hypothetical protein